MTATASHHGVPAVASFSRLLTELLAAAEKVKPTPSIEPPLEKGFVEDLTGRVAAALAGEEHEDGEQNKTRQFAVIETAVRDVFSGLIASTPIESAEFGRVWNLFDILSVLSDGEQCDPALLFWLIEELLDSQTISGCRTIFDFLESRRERITAKHFKQKQLVILRSCNELLRRLSRAEDTAFCGRVFIFMFQSFPLGDKSSVNLRGEYHVENVTTYDENSVAPGGGDEDKMEVEGEADGANGAAAAAAGPTAKAASDAKQPAAESAFNPDSLYPAFWSLQGSFSQPKSLFNKAQFDQFKTGMAATIAAFKTIQNDQPSRSTKSVDEAKRNLKKKREDGEEDVQTPFNPKYLTSRDLFELEISDLSFRRHVLVQALIIMDFLLSLSSKAKEKLATIKAPNKSVIYSDQVFSDEDTKWAVEMKRQIADYLKQGFEGPYFYRMVETVLSRDKNWVRWKMENCPSIEMSPIPPASFVDSRRASRRLTAPRRLKPPLGALSLSFLRGDDGEGANAWASYEDPLRYGRPDLRAFKRKVADADFDAEMAASPKEKAAALERKYAATWQALRLAARSRLPALDRIDDPDKIDAVFEDPAEAKETNGADEAQGEGEEDEAGELPADTRPVILAGPDGKGRAAVLDSLRKRHPGVFRRVVRHTTRPKADGEPAGNWVFVDKQRFNVMVDGDQMVEFAEVDGADCGTTTTEVNAVADKGRVPLLLLDHNAAAFARDMGFSARFMAVLPSSLDAVREELKAAGKDDEGVEKAVKAAEADMAAARAAGFYDVVVEDGDADAAAKGLGDAVFAAAEDEEVDMINGGNE